MLHAPTVVKAKTHWFGERMNQDFTFPPADKTMHLAYYGPSLLIIDLDKLHRENCDVLFLAWLLRYQEAFQAKDVTTMSATQKAAVQCSCILTRRQGESDKLAAAYQLIEGEEKAASIMGHSLLTRLEN